MNEIAPIRSTTASGVSLTGSVVKRWNSTRANDRKGSFSVRFFERNVGQAHRGSQERQALDKVVEYAYDYQNRWVRKAWDSDGDGHLNGRRIFIYDGDQIVMDFQRANSEDLQIGHLRQRYLWGPAVDQILAEEEVDGGTDDMVQWTLTDHLNTVRDIARYDPQTGITTVVNHLVYDAFGNVTRMGSRRREPAVDSLFLFTARPFDADTGLQNNLNRWYDPAVGRWLSEDPIGFTAGDGNLYRYVGNAPSQTIDPLGTNWLADVWSWFKQWFDSAKTNICPAGEPRGVLECSPAVAQLQLLSELRNKAIMTEAYAPNSPEAERAWKAYYDAAQKLQDKVEECLGR